MRTLQIGERQYLGRVTTALGSDPVLSQLVHLHNRLPDKFLTLDGEEPHGQVMGDHVVADVTQNLYDQVWDTRAGCSTHHVCGEKVFQQALMTGGGCG